MGQSVHRRSVLLAAVMAVIARGSAFRLFPNRVLSGDPVFVHPAIARIWPKLGAEQHTWINGMSADEIHTLGNLLDHYGETDFLSGWWQGLRDELEYVRNF